MQKLEASRDDVRIAALAVLAITLHVMEGAFPSPLPGIKPGISNIITVVVLCQAGWEWAVWITILRVLVGSVVLGTFLSPTFVLSLSGACGALIALGVGSVFSRRIPILKLGPLGYSVLASGAHIGAQFLVAYMLFIPHIGLLKLIPLFGGAALVFGALNGMISVKVVQYLNK